MRSHEPKAAVHDALLAAEWLHGRLEGLTYEHVAADETLQAAIERKLEIIGEALARAERADRSVAEAVPELHRIIGLRNVLAHGYDVVDSFEIYLIATTRLAALIDNLSAICDANDQG